MLSDSTTYEQNENNFCTVKQGTSQAFMFVDQYKVLSHGYAVSPKARKSFLEPSEHISSLGQGVTEPLAHRSGAAADYANRPNYKERRAKGCTPLSVNGLPSQQMCCGDRAINAPSLATCLMLHHALDAQDTK
jgi:hypothetical protein